MKDKSISILRTRREFLRQAACAALGTVALTSALRDLRLINAAVAQQRLDFSDYKALVCIFLSGGNDSNNLIVPTITSEYNNYANIRTPILALPQGSLLPISPLNSDGHSYGLHPVATQLQTLFGESKLAMLFNTGTLVQHMTGAQYRANSKPRPPQLFSHSDQVTQWQTSIPDQPPVTGWGGRCADLLYSGQPNSKISMSVSLAGANTFEVGNQVSQYSVSNTGAIALSGVTGNRLNTLTNILGLPYTNLQTKAYADVAYHSINTGQVLNTAIDPYADILEKKSDGVTVGTWMWNVNNTLTGIYPSGQQGGFPATTLGKQLKMIARLIAARSTLGMQRQIFFCSVGGYDTHTNQTKVTAGVPDTTQGPHANLLAEVSQCMYAFQRAMEQLGIGPSVTQFTCSDFGRTFPANGQGSDHGWGSHHMVLGGAVNGQRTYGKFPALTVNGPDDTNTGRWVPSTAVDQYFATLASWFGVDNSMINGVFPNLNRFYSPNLGFI